ncbi:hypothetical protein TREES_T100017734 [Tupaia chinensis]|uniref:Uncharacterized protein n=1 Tax=Tupaia chinensis TaxID=246437 RepID=L9KSE5_TUPCH|nr:hypothetical protein TREES_T100017734 [Tupaia chinensis]
MPCAGLTGAGLDEKHPRMPVLLEGGKRHLTQSNLVGRGLIRVYEATGLFLRGLGVPAWSFMSAPLPERSREAPALQSQLASVLRAGSLTELKALSPLPEEEQLAWRLGDCGLMEAFSTHTARAVSSNP